MNWLRTFLARPLEHATDARRVFAPSFAVFGLALTAASAVLGHVPVVGAAILAGIAGLCGPLISGGLSSRLAALAGRDDRTQRRAEGFAATTHGLGTTIGPALVAGLAAAVSPLAAVGALGVTSVLAALVVLLAIGPGGRSSLHSYRSAADHEAACPPVQIQGEPAKRNSKRQQQDGDAEHP